ncbi:MAG: LamG-like jellyroll fold domain-containing protein [Pseudolysinimonas sp.]
MTRLRGKAGAILAIVLACVLAGGAAWAFWLAATTAGSNGASAATSVNAGATPTATPAGANVTVSWAASTLATGQAVSGYIIKRYDASTSALQTILSACTGTVAATSCVESSVPPGSWKYTVTPRFATNWAGAESAYSSTVVIETTPPTNSITLSGITGNAGKSGNTIYYRGTAAGSFTLTNAVSDAGSGPASSQTAALTGTTTGWTHTPSTVSTPAGGPYVSNAFTWAAATTSGPNELVTGRDVAGNTAGTTLTFVDDSTAPSAGTISYLDGYQVGRSVDITFTSGTDGGSGISTRQLQRSAAALTSGTCGTFGSFINIGSNNPTSVYTDTQVFNAVCYVYRFVVTDLVGNQHIATSASVAKVDYAGAVSATAGALSYWRLGEATAALISADSFTGTSGSSLASHTGEIGATWTHKAGAANAVISNENRVRRANVTGYTIDYTTATPPSADYSVEADLYVKASIPAGETVGVIGRMDTTANTFYMARWEQADTSWNIVKYTNGTVAYPGFLANQGALVAGETYRIRLEMVGTALKLYVNGVLKVSATDATFTAAGRAGIMDGADASSAAKSDSTGIHIDNFQVTPSTYPRAVDSKGSNTGDYKNGVSLGQAGALPADSNTAALFDGVNDHVQMTSTTSIPVGASVRSTELWFKTSSAARQVLFAYGSGANTQEYGLWIDAGGASMTAWGWGNGNDKVFTMPSAVNNGAWHHVVETYNGTTLTLYIDGVALTTQAATRATVMGMYGFSVGAILNSLDGNYGGWFTGSIDEVSFYTTLLTQTNVTNHYQLGSSAASDVSGPSGGSVDASGLTGTGARYSTSTSLSIAFSPGTDTSGIAPTGATLTRATATLTSAGGTANGVCGTFGGYSAVSGGSDPVSPKVDSVTDQACYRYQYTVSDTLGNVTTYTSGDIKVDTTVPSTPSLSYSAFTNTYWSGSGTTVYYRPAAASGSFTVTGTATDAASGIASYGYPALGTNWTSTPGALGINTYSWSGAPAAPGTVNVTAVGNSSGVSANSPFTLTVDSTAPTGSAVSYASATTTNTTISVGFTTGTDATTGIGTRLLQRASASLTGTTCGSFGAFATTSGGTNPASSPVADVVTAGSCYMYQYVVADGVGNVQTAGSANVVKVALTYSATVSGTSGLVSYWRLGEALATSPMDDITATNNDGTYFNTPTVGVTGAINGDTDKAVQFDGVNDYATAARQISTNFSIEFWVKSTQNFSNDFGSPHCTFWWQGAGLVDADVGGAGNDFGISMCSGKIIAGVGNPDTNVVTAATYNDGAWHHVVFTRTQSTGALVLYVDGASAGSATGNTNALTAAATVNFGRSTAGVNYFAGTLDEMSFYNVALSAATVAAHRNAGL